MLPGPEAFLAYCAAGREIDSHFHRVDQFQVLFGVPGSYYQRHAIPKVYLHYADAFSVYGPFGTKGDVSMRFFTLRSSASDLHASMPKHRADLLYRGERQYQFDLDEYLEADVPNPGEVRLHTIINPESDGLAAYLVRIGARTDFTSPSVANSSGRYTCIIEGTLRHKDREFGPRSLGWSARGLPDLAASSGEDGCSFLSLHLPFPATQVVKLASLQNNAQQ
jgi:hypothetical protein